MKSKKKLIFFSMAILASLMLSGFPSMLVGTSASVTSLGGDLSEDFEGAVFPSWTTTGLWHLEDNSTSSYPIYGVIPSGSHYMWYGSNGTGTYNTGNTNSGELTSDPCDLTGFTSDVYLEFQSYLETESLTDLDVASVNISSDGGSNWYILISQVMDSSTWKNITVDITSYKSATVVFKFSFDTIDSEYNDYRGWMIDDVKIKAGSVESSGYFDLWIYQDYETVVGNLNWMNLVVYSYFTYDMSVNLSVIIETPEGSNITIYENKSLLIGADSAWTHSISYIFDYPGWYEVWFILIDDIGKEWYVDCYWEVYEKNFFEIYINQDNYASVNEIKTMDFDVYSYFNHSMTVKVEIRLKTPTGEISLYQNASIYISAYGNWYFTIDYTFLIAGEYQVEFVLTDDIGYQWYQHCWWKVYEGDYFATYLDQENKGFVGDLLWLDAEVDSEFSTSQTISIDLAVILPNGTLIQLYYNSSYYLAPYDYWFYYTDILAIMPGHYLVQLIITDSTGKQWRSDCWWDIQEKDEFYLWIEQDNYAKLNEERWMKFKLDSTFEDMKTISVEIYIESPTSINETLLKNDSISVPAWGHWGIEIPYKFTLIGNYTVYFIITDEFGNKWVFYCWWEIKDETLPTDPKIKIEGPSSVAINQNFTVKGVVIAGSSGLSVYGLKLFVGETLVGEHNVSFSLSAEETKTIEFTVLISSVGEYNVSLSADTDKGILNADYYLSVKVPSNDTTTVTTIPTNETSSKTDGPSTDPSVSITPGFEGIFVFLLLVPITRILRRRKQ